MVAPRESQDPNNPWLLSHQRLRFRECKLANEFRLATDIFLFPTLSSIYSSILLFYPVWSTYNRDLIVLLEHPLWGNQNNYIDFIFD